MVELDENRICASYMQAENKKKQIKILSELNACDKEQIIEIIERRLGVKAEEEQKKVAKPKKEIQPFTSKYVTVTVDKGGNSRCHFDWEQLDKQIEKLLKKNGDISAQEIIEEVGMPDTQVVRQHIYNLRATLGLTRLSSKESFGGKRARKKGDK